MRFAIFLTVFVVAAFSWSWDSSNNPTLLASNPVLSASQLPSSGVTSNIPWSDTYWPSFQSGIAHRWYNSPNPQDFKYSTYTKDQLKTMTQSQLQALSPAEKFDIMNARYDYPTVGSEWSRTHASDAQWEGICHGWAPASLYYAQPNPVTLQNSDGINVPFGSSDIKALLSYYSGVATSQAYAKFLGRRCNVDLKQYPGAESNWECRDANSGAFHVSLGSLIGVGKIGFVVDRDRSYMVWNQGVYSYKWVTSGATTQLHYCYAKETAAAWDAHTTSTVCEDLTYNLETDGSGNIIGGNWTSWDRPDFLWRYEPPSFSGYYSVLGEIYKKSTNQADLEAFAHTFAVADVQDFHLVRKTNSIHLEGQTGTFGIGPQTRARGFEKAWSIKGDAETKAILIDFTQFKTTRHQVFVKIFEGEVGQGALVAVYHGDALPPQIRVKSQGAYIVYSSDRYGATFTGSFEARYTLARE